MIEPMPKKPGLQVAKAVCDDCGRDEVVSCGYDGDQKPNEGQVIKKVNHQGWAFVKGSLRCPTCEASRKVNNVKEKQPAQVVAIKREATKAERREIMLMLAEVYDTSQERYLSGDTDDTVADVLSVMPGWVADIREEFFGPDGGNEDIEALRSEVQSAIDAGSREIKAATQIINKAKDGQDRLEDLMRKLDKIKKAVGPRNVQKAGVS